MPNLFDSSWENAQEWSESEPFANAPGDSFWLQDAADLPNFGILMSDQQEDVPGIDDPQFEHYRDAGRSQEGKIHATVRRPDRF